MPKKSQPFGAPWEVSQVVCNLPIGPQGEIINRIADTGFVWREGETLHVSCILLLRLGTENDLISIYLACHLGVVKKVKLTTYLFEVYEDTSGSTCRTVELLTEKWFTLFIRIIGKKIARAKMKTSSFA